MIKLKSLLKEYRKAVILSPSKAKKLIATIKKQERVSKVFKHKATYDGKMTTIYSIRARNKSHYSGNNPYGLDMSRDSKGGSYLIRVHEGILTEAKISSDVARAAKKLGIKFDKKKVRTIFTNDFTGVNEPGENVKYDSWMDMDPQDYLHQGRELVKALSRKYKIYKKVPSRTGAHIVFRKDKKDKKTEFTITYVKSMAGPYINYEGLKGQ